MLLACVLSRSGTHTSCPTFRAGPSRLFLGLPSTFQGFCDAGFSDSDAGVICRLMGKPFGRKLYAPKVNTRTTPITTGPTVNDYIGCVASCLVTRVTMLRQSASPAGHHAARPRQPSMQQIQISPTILQA